MKQAFLYLILIFISSCGRPEIKNPEDLIATKAKAVVFIPKIDELFKLLPAQYQKYSDVLKAAVDDSKSAALVLTSLDPLEAYFVIPIKEGLGEALKEDVDEYILPEESEIWSGYLFVALEGSLPSRYGNKDFLPEDEDSIIFAKAKVDLLIENKDEELESYKKYKMLRIFRSFSSPEMNKIFTYFVTRDLVYFLKETKELSVSLSEKSMDAKCSLLSGSNSAKEWGAMNELTLPHYSNYPDADIEFSFACKPDKITFPLKGIETGLKSYYAYMNKPEAIFPMDTVFEKLRNSGEVNAVGAFSVDASSIGGEMLFEAEKGHVLHESFAKFCKHTMPFFITGWDEGESSNMIEEATLESFKLFGRNFDKKARLKANSKHLALYYPELGKSSLKIKKSDEMAVFKAFFKPKKFFSFDTGIKQVDMKLSVEGEQINFKADFKK